jgi:hypothetical protein
MATRREFNPAVWRAALLRAIYRCEECGSKDQLELHHIGNRQGSISAAESESVHR